MATTATIALRRICELTEWSVSNLQAQKLLYFAHMIALGQSDGQGPLVSGHFQAWDLGPVLPDAYHAAKMFGSKAIKPFLFSSSGPLIDSRLEAAVTQAVNDFGGLTGSQLVAESHWSEGAWIRYYQPGARGIDISNADILAEYRARVH